jgi:DNA-binding transcriptional MerR regulator
LNDPTQEAVIGLSIAAVERDTGLSKDTLRVWERRYGFPQPSRDASGERVYPREQVDKLRVLKRLLDQGHRPGKIVGHDIEQLQLLGRATASPPTRPAATADNLEDLRHHLELIRQHRIDEFRRRLSQIILRVGLARFVIDVVAPLNTLVGDAWVRGEIEIFEEHLYTESIQRVLRHAIGTIAQQAQRSEGRPRVLLTTFPQEPHGLGVLMAEALLALDGAHCMSLGVQTPILDIARAAGSQDADLVALSFSAALNANQVLDGLADLRAKLPPRIGIWAGGACPVLHRRAPAGIRTLRSLEEIAPAVAHWRAEHGAH